MKAKDHNKGVYEVLYGHFIGCCKDQTELAGEKAKLDKFFAENGEMEFNEFLNLLNQKYGNLLSDSEKDMLKIKSNPDAERDMHAGCIVQFIILLISIFVIIISISTCSSI